MRGHEVALLAAAFASELLGTIGGFGSSTFFVPLANLFESVPLVLAITAVLHVFGNTAKLILFRRSIDRRLLLSFGVPAAVTTAIGAALTDKIATGALELTLGLLLVTLSTVFLAVPGLRMPTSERAVLSASAMSGFFTGFVGTGGAIRGMTLAAFHIEKNVFVATSAAIDLPGDLLRGAIYLQKGYLDRAHLFYVPLLLLVAYGGTKLGRRLLHRFSERTFRTLVLSLILAMGLLTVGKALVAR
jgi:uncharacterized membrane protein YfcA